MADAIEIYDVCLSFADEQRDYVNEVANLLRDSGLRVFYDQYETAELWGRDLYTHLAEIYNHRSRYCILFASADYARKVWTNHERESAQARAVQSSKEYLLPVRFDDTSIPGLGDTIGYLDARRSLPRDVVAALHRKLDRPAPAVATLASVLVLTVNEPEVNLARIFDRTTERCGITASWSSQTGPFLTAVFPTASHSIGSVANTLLPEAISTAEDVLQRHPDARLRIGLHIGDVHRGAEQDSAAATTITRAVTDKVVGDLLTRAPRGICVSVLSQLAYNKISCPNPTSYVRLLLSDGQVVFARLPGYPKPPPGHPSDLPVPQGGPGKYNLTFNGNTEIGRIGDGN